MVKGKRVAVLGLAFKANTDDIRFAPALEVVKRLLEEGAVVHATDPEGMPRTKPSFRRCIITKMPIRLCKTPMRRWFGTEWDVFRKLDWDRAGKLMARKLVIDGRNLYTPQGIREKRLRILLLRPRVVFAFNRGNGGFPAPIYSSDISISFYSLISS